MALDAVTDLNPSPRVLLGPGPSAVHPRVLRAMSTPLLGYMDPEFLKLMDETVALLRHTFQTANTLTLPVSGTGMAGMETVLANLLAPGEKLLVCSAGFFANRQEEVARRHGIDVVRVDKPWGQPYTAAEFEAAVKQHQPKVVALVHAETSTGAVQPLDGFGDIAHRYGALLLIDTVTSLGGVPLKIDEWGVDAAYSGTQKCLGCPPGLSPVTISDRARAAIKARLTPPDAWYFDLEALYKYWGPDRVYHHTVSGTLVYALREGLRLVAEEGLGQRWTRHAANADYFCEGLAELDLVPFIEPAHRLPSLITVRVPNGVDEAAVRTKLRDIYNIEIGAGIGSLKGQVWRVGLMGYSSRHENITLLLGALREILK